MSSGLIDTSSGVPPALENSPAVLPSDGTVGHRWAVVLAGGDGTRLQSLTLKIAGDQRQSSFVPSSVERLFLPRHGRALNRYFMLIERCSWSLVLTNRTIARSYGTWTNRVSSRNAGRARFPGPLVDDGPILAWYTRAITTTSKSAGL